MTKITRLVILLAALGGMTALPAAANSHGPRQYYSGWEKHPRHDYHYRRYYYKPKPSYSGYKHHYVIYHRSRPKHLYFFNPYKKQFWGRCPSSHSGEGVYSLLNQSDRRGRLSEIPESAFPALGPVPEIPESIDDVPLDLPPDDLPDGIGVTAPPEVE